MAHWSCCERHRGRKCSLLLKAKSVWICFLPYYPREQNILLRFTYFHFILCVCAGICLYICSPCLCLVPKEGRRRQCTPWNWGYKWSSARAASAHAHWAVPSAPHPMCSRKPVRAFHWSDVGHQIIGVSHTGTSGPCYPLRSQEDYTPRKPGTRADLRDSATRTKPLSLFGGPAGNWFIFFMTFFFSF